MQLPPKIEINVVNSWLFLSSKLKKKVHLSYISQLSIKSWLKEKKRFKNYICFNKINRGISLKRVMPQQHSFYILLPVSKISKTNLFSFFYCIMILNNLSTYYNTSEGVIQKRSLYLIGIRYKIK